MVLIEEFHRWKVEVLFVNRPIAETPEDHLLLQIQGVIAEYERAQLLERCRRGKIYKAKQGDLSALGKAPYGYIYRPRKDNQPAYYEIHPEEAPVIKEIFHLVTVEHKSLTSTTRQLNKKQYKPRRATFWQRSTVNGILRNPAYMGQAAYQKRQNRPRQTAIASSADRKGGYPRPKGSVQRRRPEDWIYLSVPALISPETFALAQEQLKVNKQRAERNKKHEDLLSHLLRCKECGYAMYGRTKTLNKTKYRYYCCLGEDHNRFMDGKSHCTASYIRGEIVDNLVWSQITRLLQQPDLVLYEHLQHTQAKQETQTSLKTLLNQHQHTLQTYTAQKERLLDLYQTGLIEQRTLDSRLKQVREKIHQLEQKYQDLEKELH